MRISDWSSDVCSSDLGLPRLLQQGSVILRREDDVCAFNPDDFCKDVALPTPVMNGSEVILLTARNSTELLSSAVVWLSGTSVGDRSEERRVGKECVSRCR